MTIEHVYSILLYMLVGPPCPIAADTKQQHRVNTLDRTALAIYKGGNPVTGFNLWSDGPAHWLTSSQTGRAGACRTDAAGPISA